jgi:hypothetical protein
MITFANLFIRLSSYADFILYNLLRHSVITKAIEESIEYL